MSVLDASQRSILLERAATLLRAEVVGRDYSSGAWRVECDGRVLTTRQPYPGHVRDGYAMPPIDAPVCADTKREAEARLRQLRVETARLLLLEAALP